MRQSWMNHAYACIAISPLLFKYRLLRSVLVGVSCLETSTPATICEFINWLLVIYFHYCLISDFLWELDIGQRAAGYVQHCYLSVICIYLHTCTLISLNRNLDISISMLKPIPLLYTMKYCWLLVQYHLPF